MTPSTPKAALARSNIAALSGFVGKQLGDEIVDQSFVIALEVRAACGANGVDRVLR